jgi:hypothetical protein
MRPAASLPVPFHSGKVVQPMRRRRLSIPEILAWADRHYEHTGRWPTDDCGPVEDAPGETWAALETALDGTVVLRKEAGVAAPTRSKVETSPRGERRSSTGALAGGVTSLAGTIARGRKCPGTHLRAYDWRPLLPKKKSSLACSSPARRHGQGEVTLVAFRAASSLGLTPG